jgi:hypothetical protein
MIENDEGAQEGMNETRIGTGSDAKLTRGRSTDVLRDLLVKRNLVDAESREGRLLSNLIKQTLWQDDPDSDRSWAKHPTQNLPWMMKVQIKALAN